MDPNTIAQIWLNNEDSAQDRRDYNEWTASGGFAASVQIAAHTDLFMRGERFGTIVQLSTAYARVRGDRSGRVFRLTRDSIERIVGH